MPTHLEIVLRLALGAVLGGLVGLERERLEWVAGLRTHMLVCVGATLIMIVSIWGFGDIVGRPGVVLDPSRVAAQVVSGIGFLGAGTILFLRQEVIRGLTTAASLWTVAGVGLAVGGGLYVAAIAATVLVLVILALVKPLEKRLFRRDQVRRFEICIDREQVTLREIDAIIESTGLPVDKISLSRGEDSVSTVKFTLLKGTARPAVADLLDRIQRVSGVLSVTS